MTNHHYDNSERLDGVSEQDWREALDELTAYLTWRLRGKTAKGAHSEKVLGMPAFDYYQEEAVVKLIEGDWKWQDHFTLGKQLEKIAANLITKQKERYARNHGITVDESTEDGILKSDVGGLKDEVTLRRKLQLVELRDPEMLPDCIDDDGQEELDETYAVVMALVADNEELTLYVQAIQECNSFFDLPERMGIPIKRVYRLQEKLMRRIRRWRDSQIQDSSFRVQDV